MIAHKYETAVVCGKFYPPHSGHHFLINTAVEMSDRVTVLICWRADETLPVDIRIKCLQEEHPTVKIIPVPCIPADDDSPGWGKYTMGILGYSPDAVFSSEDCGEPYAKAMLSQHVMVDHERTKIPCSGTTIRKNPTKYFEFPSPTMKAYYAKRIVVVGAESTGTTTISEILSKYYKTWCVLEYGRTYASWMHKLNDDWYPQEFVHIGNEQNKLEDLYARSANKLLICDTDSLATMVWSWRYSGYIANELKNIAKNRNKYYILTGDEIPFVQDGTRDGENIRHKMHEQFIKMLEYNKKQYIIVTGSKEERLKQSIKFINDIIGND
jgi:HTH-type transcriptional regulator, transcriptional repressor of NAD biosynthesis genes